MANNFWKNVSRYPSFFISSMIGLLLIILTPIKNLFKNNKLKPILLIGFLVFLLIIYLILASMLSL